jgi:serine protease Do
MVSRRIGLLVVALVATACRGEQSMAAQQTAPSQTPPRPTATLDASRRTAIVDASTRVASAVVSVRVTLPTPRPSSWDLFTGAQPGTPQSFGTGFVLRADGIVVTNQHVVANAQQITVTLADGTDVEGRLLGEDPLTDIAVIKLERRGLDVVDLGRSSDLMIGEWAIAVGNPYSYLLGNAEPTVTVGVISATGRNILPTGEQNGLYLDMIQTDAAINPGNSGGPLVNALGQVIGVNSSIFSSSGGSVGLGFAIPIERAVRVAEEIIRNGSVRRAWVGLEVAQASEMGEWKRTGGVPVVTVAPSGPAASAGLRPGDVLVRANGRTLRNSLDWESVKLDLHVGDPVTLVVQSGGQTRERRLVSSDLPTATATRVRFGGLDLVTVTPAVRAQLNVRSAGGAAITKVPAELARETGLREGDVIVGINRTQVRSAEEVAAILDGMRPGSSFQLVIERRGTLYPLNLRI